MRYCNVPIAVLLALLLAACGSVRNEAIPVNPSEFAPPDIPVLDQIGGAYRISPMDTINVTVFKVPELSGQVKVDRNGTIAVPLLGDVTAAGLTARELSNRLREGYGERYLRNPDVTVQVGETQVRRITVEGSVVGPGVFTINGKSNLLEAVALARGPSEYANDRRVVVFRRINGETQAAAFDLAEVRAGLQRNPEIFSGDIVVVDGSNVKRVYRDVLSTIPILAIFTRF